MDNGRILVRQPDRDNAAQHFFALRPFSQGHGGDGQRTSGSNSRECLYTRTKPKSPEQHAVVRLQSLSGLDKARVPGLKVVSVCASDDAKFRI